ncbi:hypothetical protein BSNK01_19790 [Bacillaceae bacterium]
MENEISYNNIGIEVWTSSAENLLAKNQLMDNVIQISRDGKQDKNQWEYNGVGNAWSDQAIFDLDQDGIGDQPYIYTSFFGTMLSKYPLGHLFINSPALKIYENMEKIFQTDQEPLIDRYPLVIRRESSGLFAVAFLIMLIAVVFWARKIRKA